MFFQHQLLPLNSKLPEPESYKDTERNRFVNAVLTDHSALFIAKESDTRDQVY